MYISLKFSEPIIERALSRNSLEGLSMRQRQLIRFRKEVLQLRLPYERFAVFITKAKIFI